MERLRDTWLERARIQDLRFQRAKKEENQGDLRTLYHLALNTFAKFDNLRERLNKEAAKLEASQKVISELCNLSNRASMDAKSALSNRVWMPEKEVLPQKEVVPEDTDQPADAPQDSTLFLSCHPKASTASGSTPPPWASASSAPSASSEPDLSRIIGKFSPEELALLQAVFSDQ